MRDFFLMRQNMVKNQLLPNDIVRPDVVHAFTEIPRELFVPDELKALAYSDQSLCISSNRPMLQPLIIAWLLDRSGIKESDHVLVLGALTGYTVALLSFMATKVTGIEADETLRTMGQANLQALGIRNASLTSGEALKKHTGSYDVVLIETPAQTANSLRELPAHQHLLGLVSEGNMTQGVLRTRHQNKYTDKILFETCGSFEWNVFSKRELSGS